MVLRALLIILFCLSTVWADFPGRVVDETDSLSEPQLAALGEQLKTVGEHPDIEAFLYLLPPQKEGARTAPDLYREISRRGQLKPESLTPLEKELLEFFDGPSEYDQAVDKALEKKGLRRNKVKRNKQQLVRAIRLERRRARDRAFARAIEADSQLRIVILCYPEQNHVYLCYNGPTIVEEDLRLFERDAVDQDLPRRLAEIIEHAHQINLSRDPFFKGFKNRLTGAEWVVALSWIFGGGLLLLMVGYLFGKMFPGQGLMEKVLGGHDFQS